MANIHDISESFRRQLDEWVNTLAAQLPTHLQTFYTQPEIRMDKQDKGTDITYALHLYNTTRSTSWLKRTQKTKQFTLIIQADATKRTATITKSDEQLSSQAQKRLHATLYALQKTAPGEITISL